MKIQDAIHELNTKPLVSLWPTAAMVLGISRSAVYGAAQRGEIETIYIGRLRKAITAPLRKKLKLGEVA
jgi:hypothetical protein